jgi:hypothetical protein
MIWAATIGGALVVGVLSGAWIPTVLLAIEGILISISIVGAWIKFGRGNLPIVALLAVPLYILWKIPLYLAFLVRPQKSGFAQNEMQSLLQSLK